MRSLLSAILIVLNLSALFGQCPTVDFSIPGTACKNSEFSLPTTITNATSFSWDMCDGSISNFPVSTRVINNTGITSAFDLAAVEENGNYFLFSVDFDDGQVWRYDFGNDLGSIPALINLGNFGGTIQNPLGIGLWKESGNNYGLVVTAGGELYRLNFGNSISNTPSITQIIGITGLSNHRHIEITSDGGSILAIIAGGNTTGISILNFGSSITNQPTRTFVSFGAGIIASLDLVIECNNRYILASGYGGGSYLLDFGNSFLNPTPTVSQPAGLSGNMLGLSVVKSEGQYYAVISNQPLGIIRANFGSSITNPNPQIDNLGVFNSVGFAIGHQIIKSKAHYYSAAIDLSGKMSILEFPKDCPNKNDFFGDDNPVVSFNSPGTYSVTLSALGSENEFVSITKNITITSTDAPALVINEDGACLNNQVIFAGQQANGGAISGLMWDFGDGTQGSGQSAAHLYASTGMYSVVLDATATNGCINRIEKNINIYNAPIASFTLPSGQLCSNNDITFVNTTTDNFNGILTYQWLVDNQPISTDRNMVAAFSTVGSHEVTLQTFIPGCSDDDIQNIAGVLEGPVTNFSFLGQCEDQNITFTNNSSGTIDGYSWDFDDSSPVISNPNPTHIFSTIGTYDVTLTASNTATGCNNTKTKSVPIYSVPLVNFLLLPPPFSCNGTPSQFNDQTPTPTDSNISSWSWNFGDAGSSQNTSAVKNPQHTYANVGVYDVSLLVATNFLCSATIQLPVTISQTPIASFSNGPPCEDVPVAFSDTSPGTIQAWNWTIGSSTYTTKNPTHTFINPGSTTATLSVTASNNCIGTTTPKPIVVPAKLSPDFSVAKNCINQQTVFTDITNGTADPISSNSWSFGALGTATGSPTTFTFLNIGNVNVTHTVTTQTGCVYPVSRLVNIIQSPQASFTASPLIGAQPLPVQFTNTSVNATSYLWNFGDANNSTSTQISPTFTYTTLGTYLAQLTAFNAQNCSHSSTSTIRVVNPMIDVALGGLELVELQNGSFKPAVTIFNNGNVPVNNLSLLIDIAGSAIREHVNYLIMPNTSYRYVFSFEFLYQEGTNYFCIEAEVDDITPADNRVCMNFDESITTFPPYPNPTKGEMQVDWIMKEDGIVNLTLINSMGQEVRNIQVNSIEGFNPFRLDSKGLVTGAYFLKFKYQHFTQVYRVFISE